MPSLKRILVITFTCSTVADGNCAFFLRSQLILAIAGRAMDVLKEIFVFVYSTCLYTWNDEVITESFYDIFDI